MQHIEVSAGLHFACDSFMHGVLGCVQEYGGMPYGPKLMGHALALLHMVKSTGRSMLALCNGFIGHNIVLQVFYCTQL